MVCCRHTASKCNTRVAGGHLPPAFLSNFFLKSHGKESRPGSTYSRAATAQSTSRWRKAPEVQHTAEPSFSFSDLQSYKLGRTLFSFTGDVKKRRTSYCSGSSQPTHPEHPGASDIPVPMPAGLLDEPSPTRASPHPYVGTPACWGAFLALAGQLSPRLF